MQFAVRFESDSLKFTASHAIRFDSGEMEERHEHEFRIRAEITGPLNSQGYLIDFMAAQAALEEIVQKLNGKSIFAADSYSGENTEGNDTYLIPCENATAERLAEHILMKFRAELEYTGAIENDDSHYVFRIELEESPGSWAVCTDFL